MTLNEPSPAWTLASHDPEAGMPVLTGVQANVRLDSICCELVLRQTYRNTGARTLEVVYTFPLPPRAVLLGFASTLNGARLEGCITPKAAAEATYEQALADGDAPVLLEAHDGLVTANLGNLKPGDEVELEVRTAQLLVFEQGRLRIAIPSTIAPRYGDPAHGGLQPQQVPEVSMLADYPLALTVTVGRSLAGAAIECPTHRTVRSDTADGVCLTLDATARLDRDVVVIVTPREERPAFSLHARDATSTLAPTVVMASFVPPPAPQRDHIALKLLVDCSGSMGGDSIVSARAALHGIARALGDADHVAFSRFGSTVQHVMAPMRCTPQALRGLQAQIDATDATLGGTEMAAALRGVFALPLTRDAAAADVLLLTDGEIWEVETLIALAKRSGQRVFVIGVGASPAESVLRRLAGATGGACELATPGEALEAAAQRMLARIRQQAWREVRVDGGSPLWQTPLPAAVFAGDTVTVFAGMPAGAAAQPLRLLACDVSGRGVELGCTATDAALAGDMLPRLAAAARLPLVERAEALQLALDHQLISDQTHCVLVHRRAEGQRAQGETQLVRVPSMLAAGWGATGSVRSVAMPMAAATPMAAAAPMMDFCAAMPAPIAAAGGKPAVAFDSLMCSEAETPYDAGPPPAITPEDFARAVVEHVRATGAPDGLAVQLGRQDPDDDLLRAIDVLRALGLDEDMAWLVFAHWVNVRIDGAHDAAVTAVLAPHASLLAADVVLSAMQALDRWRLAPGPLPGDTRAQRLKRAMAR
ncbi:VWA domain-containing protein [Aquincola sp. S2]|uniref:VWA domain-containing protein n=1 Tax=Pseudaquabacterium terrae TaxID=2732868 RepID=A0ABX2E9K7_9BURK|nr:VIT domain-containing protein [Aquabacterium terrae]NRF65438.1 VWA domain-containing protein [Aquabacterium terrae]